MNVYPNSAALFLADVIHDELALAELKLFKEITQPPSVSTVLADITECDYDGYAGIVITAWLAAYLDPAGGASFQSGTKQFQYGPAAVPPVPNTVLGFYIVNAGGALMAVGTFTSPVSMGQLGDAIPLNVTLNWAKSA